MINEHLRRDLPAEGSAVLQGMMKMQPGENSRPIHLFHPIRCAFERVGMNAIAEGAGVVDHHPNLGRPEKIFDEL